MRKAFDANVPKLKPRLHPVGIATIDPEGLFAESGEPEAAQVEPAVQVEAAAQDPVVEPAPVERPAPCLLYTSPSPRDRQKSRMPSSA